MGKGIRPSQHAAHRAKLGGALNRAIMKVALETAKSKGVPFWAEVAEEAGVSVYEARQRAEQLRKDYPFFDELLAFRAEGLAAKPSEIFVMALDLLLDDNTDRLGELLGRKPAAVRRQLQRMQTSGKYHELKELRECVRRSRALYLQYHQGQLAARCRRHRGFVMAALGGLLKRQQKKSDSGKKDIV